MPRFPFRTSPGQDLRDLFGAERLRAQSRDLGSSSITQGEGSLELRPTDDGPAVAMFGDLPGGGFGVGVPDGAGGWRTVQQDAQVRADAAQAAAEAAGAAANAALAGRVTSAEGRLGTTEGRLSTAESKNSQQDGRLDSHASRLGATENDVTAMQSTIAAQAGTIAGQSALISQLRADFNGMAAWIHYPGTSG